MLEMEPAPTNRAYINHLRSTATLGSVGDAAAAPFAMPPGPTTRSANVCAKQSTPSTSRGPLSVSRACWPKASRLSAFYWIGSSGYGRSAVKTHARRLPDQQPLRVHVQGDGLPARNVAPVEEVAHGRRP